MIILKTLENISYSGVRFFLWLGTVCRVTRIEYAEKKANLDADRRGES